MANPHGRPRSVTVKLTKTAREHFDRQLAGRGPDIFTALFEAGTKEKDTAALSLLVNRAVPVRKGVPVNFKPDHCPIQVNAPKHSATSSQRSGEVS